MIHIMILFYFNDKDIRIKIKVLFKHYNIYNVNLYSQAINEIKVIMIHIMILFYFNDKDIRIKIKVFDVLCSKDKIMRNSFILK